MHESLTTVLILTHAGMIFLSDEDVDVKRLLARWLNTQPKELRAGLSGWVDDMFFRSESDAYNIPEECTFQR